MAEATSTTKATKVKVKFGTLVHKCTCKGTLATDYQDKILGNGMRIFNYAKQGKEARCTCCTRMIDAKSSEQTNRGHTFQENILLRHCKIKESDLTNYIKRR